MTTNIDVKDIDLIAVGIPHAWPAHLKEGAAALGEGIVNSAREVARAFQAEVRELHQRGKLTPQGMLEDFTEMAVKQITELDRAAGDQIGKLRRARDEATARLAKLPAGIDPATVRLVQEQLLALPATERLAALHEAAADGEAVVLQAAFTLPKFLRRKLTDQPAALDALHEQWIALRDPAAAGELRELEEAITLAERAVAGARRAIVGTPSLDDSTRRAISERILPDPLKDIIAHAR